MELLVRRTGYSFFENHKAITEVYQENNLLAKLKEEKRNILFPILSDSGAIEVPDESDLQMRQILIMAVLICREELRIKD